jgi:hypothetical protein
MGDINPKKIDKKRRVVKSCPPLTKNRQAKK